MLLLKEPRPTPLCLCGKELQWVKVREETRMPMTRRKGTSLRTLKEKKKAKKKTIIISTEPEKEGLLIT